jgi:hypothetical protein
MMAACAGQAHPAFAMPSLAKPLTADYLLESHIMVKSQAVLPLHRHKAELHQMAPTPPDTL